MNRREFIRASSALLAALVTPRVGAPLTISGGTVTGGSLNPSVGGGGGTVDLSIIPESRRTVWNPGIYGGIPPDDANASTFPNGVGPATQHGSTLSPLGGDDRAQIQNALDAAGTAASKTSRRFVLLGSGTFSVSSSITIPSYVVLRGTLGASNARNTIISPSSSGFIVFIMSGSFSAWGTIYSVTGTPVRGDSTITLNTTTGLSVGDLIKLDHLSDGDRSGKNGVLSWSVSGSGANITTTGMSRNWDATPAQTDACVFGNSALSQVRADDDSPNWASQDYPDSPGESGNTDRGWRHMDETHEILAINGNTITVFSQPTVYAQDGLNADVSGSPVRMWYYRDPEVYRCSGAAGVDKEYAGIEDLAIYPREEASVLLTRAKFCWIQNVESNGDQGDTGFTHNGRHFRLEGHTYRCEVKSCYVHGQQGYSSGGRYGINIKGSDHYVHDTVSRNHNKPINLEAADGCVVAYCVADNAIISNPTAQNESGIGTHASFCHNNLFEGNISNNVTIDSEHGNNGFNVAFRNWLMGKSTFVDAPAGYTGTQSGLNRAIMSDAMNWEMTSIGNVCYEPTFQASRIETSGHSTTWFTVQTTDGIYVCGHNGWSDNGAGGECVDDGFALSYLHYHLDYWHTSEGAGSRLYSNPGNAVSTQPNSLHRSSTPDYFTDGAHTYPWIDSSETVFANQVKTLPAKSRYDAGEA